MSSDLVWLRDLDGTGSMHPCSKDAPGAIEYIPAAALARKEAALKKIADGDFEQAVDAVAIARQALNKQNDWQPGNW